MPSKIRPSARAGVAMMLVLVLSVVILAVGMSMIGLTGNVMSASVDAKTKIKARYAAESAISASIADAVYQASNTFGGSISDTSRDVSQAGDAGTANVSSGNNLGQELILQKMSPMNGMRGYKIPLLINASGKSGGAKAKIVASVALYQVPIYQFGVFYDGPLEITPGSNMTVKGRVHTNSDAYFRGVANLTLQGPVTTVGNIYQWKRSGAGILNYQCPPDSPGTWTPPLNLNPTVMGSSQTRNVKFQQTRLTLAIGVGTPRSILGVRDPVNDPIALQHQKFDWLVADPKRCTPAARWVVLGPVPPARPAWITGPRVFYDRREQRWVKVWDFDVGALAASSNRDSIFYLDDTTTSYWHMGNTPPLDTHQVINAFRIRNAVWLPRNMTIACGRPVYIMGDFNKQNSPNPADTFNYKNAQIASDAITVLSNQWMSWDTANIGGAVGAANSSLERPYADPNWLACTGNVCNAGNYAPTPTGGNIGANIRINAAIITGNKASSAACLTSTTEAAFESCYEGGWHNSLRFLEQWGSPIQRTVTFLGSYVCMWQAQTPQLASGTTVWNTNYYGVPVRIWGYDTRFDLLENMPPASPFLATAILTNWLERN